mmetsp:Transcript_6510/g.20325  ORF Transcript_6510/g.20325 Transcript_6510/m.20325 type:complete len:227 (+) Transcript_6510:3-683(+)|eukprot:scaffold268251_cov37-Tisochrysis_lutea.AAC.3
MLLRRMACSALLPRLSLGLLAGSSLGLGSLRVWADERQKAPLGELYADAVEAFVDVPGCESLSSADGVLYLAPSKAGAERVEWPKLISKSVIYSFTAWNPHGQTASDAANKAANARLEADIDNLRLKPRATWRCFGFNVKEGWREEGFSLAYDPAERRFALNEVMRLASRYRQAAVYMYMCKEGVVVRETLWVDRAAREEHADDTPVVMMRLANPPPSELAARGKL